jgi:predicted metal-binding membrane protein
VQLNSCEQQPVHTSGLVSGFFTIWFGFAGLLAFLQLNLINAGLITSMGQSVSTLFSVTILFSAGAYQFTQLKDRCLSHCRSPMIQFIQHWKPGFLGGVNMGLHHGTFCVACCWGLMAIGFVGGIMDLRWMGGATLLMTLEKLPDIGRRVTKPIGIGLILWGIALAAT